MALLLRGSVAVGMLLALGTELLSAVGGLTPVGVAAWWGLWGAAAAAAAYLGVRSRVRPAAPAGAPTRTDPAGAALWLGLAVLMLGVLAVALTAAPATNDSIDYHLPRVEHWADAGSVAHFPTACRRQVFMNPGAEFALLHLRLLTGGDRLANLVQFAAMAVGVAAVARLARRLGAGPTGRRTAAVAAATLPMGLLQASGTQNDWCAALWLAVFAVMVVEDAGGAWCGAALGLAVLAKGTAYVYGLPLLAWYVADRFARRGQGAWATLLIAAVAAAAPNLGHWSRNAALCGSPLGVTHEGRDDDPHFRLANAEFGAGPLASNVLRNLALHAAVPWVTSWNHGVERAVLWLHRRMDRDVLDPAVTYGGWFEVEWRPDEDAVGNPAHLLLIAAAAVALLRRPPRRRAALALAGCVAAGFVLFCVLVTWQPWASRLHLPLFVLAAPLIGLWAERLPRSVAGAPAAVLLAAGLWLAADNDSRPLLGPRSVLTVPRAEQLFRDADRRYAFEAIAATVPPGAGELGLVGFTADEYFIRAALRGAGRSPRLRHVLVDNVTRHAGPPDRPLPEWLLVRVDPGEAPADGTDGHRIVRMVGALELMHRR